MKSNVFLCVINSPIKFITDPRSYLLPNKWNYLTEEKSPQRFSAVAYDSVLSANLRFCHRSDGRHGFEKNISSCTVSYTALLMKTDLRFQPTLS